MDKRRQHIVNDDLANLRRVLSVLILIMSHLKAQQRICIRVCTSGNNNNNIFSFTITHFLGKFSALH